MITETMTKLSFRNEIMNAGRKYGRNNVDQALLGCKVFCQSYGDSHRIVLWREYMMVVPMDATDALEEAQMVFDLSAGKLIIDRKELFLDNSEVF